MSNLYNIELLKNVEKFIKKQSKDIKRRIIIAILHTHNRAFFDKVVFNTPAPIRIITMPTIAG